MKFFIIATATILLNLTLSAQNAKENKGSFPINSAKANQEFFTNINDEVFQLKYVSVDKAKNTYYFTGNIPLYYKDHSGVGNTGFTIGSDHSISGSAEKTESGGSFAFKLSLKISDNKAAFVFSDYVHSGTGAIGNGGPYEGYPVCGSDKIGGIPNWESFKKQADTESENIVNKLKKLLQ